MQDIWYGDRRDRVKWGALVHLARTQQLSKIVQVAYYRRQADRQLEIDQVPILIPEEVWNHFSSLGNIRKLEQETLKIVVLDQVFEPKERQQYISKVIQTLRQHARGSKVVFLDPDTGIEPSKAGPQHVKVSDIKEIWKALEIDDWLAMYQHAHRKKDWLDQSRQKFARACGVEHIKTYQGPTIAADVAVFAARKTSA